MTSLQRVLVLGLLILDATVRGAACREKPVEVGKPTGAQLEKFVEFLKAKGEKVETQAPLWPWNISSGNGMHIADVNNDGLTEYLWVSTSGSGGYSGVNGIYQEKGDGFVQVPFYSDYEPSDIPDHFAEPILTKACGTVYMGFYEEGVPVKYLWKDDKFRRACDEATTAEIEGNFKKAYRSKKYDLAYKTARYLHQACDTLPEKRFWRLNDMAVSAYHTSMPPDVCLGHLEAARNMTDYVKSNAKAAVALKTNEALCTAKPKR